MAVLNTHWEDLRVRAMDRQTRLVISSRSLNFVCWCGLAPLSHHVVVHTVDFY
jgi:hypothetical protein